MTAMTTRPKPRTGPNTVHRMYRQGAFGSVRSFIDTSKDVPQGVSIQGKISPSGDKSMTNMFTR